LNPDPIQIRIRNTVKKVLHYPVRDPDLISSKSNPNPDPHAANLITFFLCFFISDVNPVEAKKNLEKPLLRRKSDLPTDLLTQRSLENYQRADEYLSTPAQPPNHI
jgi:hypothetical protein